MFGGQDSIGDKNYFPFGIHDFCIVEIDLFDDSLNSLYFDSITNLEGLAHNDRETSEKIGDNISTGESKDGSSYTRSGKKSTGIYLQTFEDEKSSDYPDNKQYDKPNRREKFSHGEIITDQAIFYLAYDETHEIGDDSGNKESSKRLIDIIEECPGLWFQSKNS